jgi:hypothetical protein
MLSLALYSHHIVIIVAAGKCNKPLLQLAVSGMPHCRGNKIRYGMKTGRGRVAPYDADLSIANHNVTRTRKS